MMCAGGTDCAANVWILEMWPGKDAWLQALHFSFAVGCALGPLIVEPFLSVEYKPDELERLNGKHSGTTTINDQNNETRIHIPYGLSGLASVLAAVYILYLYFLEQRRYRLEAIRLRAKEAGAACELVHLAVIGQPSNPVALEAGQVGAPLVPPSIIVPPSPRASRPSSPSKSGTSEASQQQADKMEVYSRDEQPEPPKKQVEETPAVETDALLAGQQLDQQASSSSSEVKTTAISLTPQPPPPAPTSTPPPTATATTITITPDASQQTQLTQPQLIPPQQTNQPPQRVKITSKATEQQQVGRPPYYVMFAIALAAMCLSFYCGIEITSMNYLATFAVNIDLQLPKSTAALMSSALTISFAVGRGFGIWIAAYMKPHKLFYLCAGVMATGNVFMLIFANTAETLLWCSICLFGIGCGPMFPAIVSFYDDRISKVTNTVSGIFILGSMFNVALNSLIIGHHIIDNALILIVCNLVGSVLLMLLFGTLHMLTKVKKNQRVRKFNQRQQFVAENNSNKLQQEQQLALIQSNSDANQINQASNLEMAGDLNAPEEDQQLQQPQQQNEPTTTVNKNLTAITDNDNKQ